MLPSEAIQVIENTRSRIIVLDPPYYSFGIYLLVLGIISVTLGLVLFFRHNAASFAVTLVIVAVPLLAFGSFLMTAQRMIIMSRTDGALTLKKSKWGLTSSVTLPLEQIRRVTVETIGYNQSLVIVTKAGESFSLGNGSNRKGYNGASDAMNDFLGSDAR
jgi:hypothetical protein